MDSPALNRALYWVGARCLAADFPPTSHALSDPDGLLAIGGDLGPARLLEAYGRGIFPWYSDGQPVLWWAPATRAVLAPADVHVSRSLAKRLRNGGFTLTFDTAFEAVIAACAGPRADATGTWITAAMRAAYTTLYHGGYAHSIECRRDGELVGGLYGVALGRVFCGESMFAHARDASKVAFVQLCRWLADWGYGLVDCQLPTPHLASLGATEMPRAAFEERLRELAAVAPAVTAWRHAA
ncbi:MAG: leucyl/phenylalanyl-tRNA--protein transferase [Gammaproteobacteria bacterium]|nr:leucyl/phenylalanyl-tRNA--protein transferase [Gammaproteobacteria bacterium]MCP5202463.1 leucyl/phenylalanyl-tRNA--protein transferase [Gammaproteobacteria bacterium]